MFEVDFRIIFLCLVTVIGDRHKQKKILEKNRYPPLFLPPFCSSINSRSTSQRKN